MTARFEGTRTYTAPKERIFRACIDAMQLSGFKITASDSRSGSIIAVSGDSQYSSRSDSGFLEEVGLIFADMVGLLSKFRERISVRIGDDGSVHALSVSEPRTIRLDQGRNMQHVLRLWEALDAALGHGDVVPEVTNDGDATVTSDTGSMRDELAGTAARDLAAAAGPVSAGHAFISYVREDSGKVDALQGALEAAGVPVWRDTSDLWPGEDWRARIWEAITRNALVFIACFSRRSVVREESYQNEELALAIDQLRRRRLDLPWLIPVRFDDCDLPDFNIGAGRTLASLQCADLFGEGRDEATARLIRAVVRILEPERQRREASASVESKSSLNPGSATTRP